MSENRYKRIESRVARAAMPKAGKKQARAFQGPKPRKIERKKGS